MPQHLLSFVLAGALAAAPALQQTPAPKKEPQAKPADKSLLESAKQQAAEDELQRAIEQAGNEQAALVRNLEDYLRRFPDAPRKQAVYRALVEAAMQLRDLARALDYAERLIALRPADSSMMLFAADLLEQKGDELSLTKAVGYVTQVLDRVEKQTAEGRSPRVSAAEWNDEQKKLRMSVRLIRGRLEMARRNYEAAMQDLEASYAALPNPAAALRLGEIAELRKENDQAIEHYLTAFVLPDLDGTRLDRGEVRRKLGNLWRLGHGSEARLGERLLAAYDRVAAQRKAPAAVDRNANAAEPYNFELRRLDASTLKLAELKGKVLVLNFWATWCLPCREMEPLFEQVQGRYAGKSEAVFLAVNGDEDESLVKPYVEKEKMRAPVVFADGLERILEIRAIPTVIVLDRAGKIVFRVQGFTTVGFVEELTAAIERALAGAN